jgi:hypothetical protein
MLLKKYLLLLFTPLLFISCISTDTNEKEKNKTIVQKINRADLPKKIKILFVTQPHCPSCNNLERTMRLKKPLKLIQNYFELEKIFLGKKLPDGLIPPNGTPTVYFLGYRDEPLIEPMIGEKSEEELIMFLEDALLEFKNLYDVDLVTEKGENHDKNQTKENNSSKTNR